jgi:hypothetical protein
MAAGWAHNVALRDDGTVLAWGDNRSGQSEEPVPNWGFVAVAAGGKHSLALRANGSIVAWGSNTWGQCDVPAPNTGFVAIAGGGNYSVGLQSDGTLVAWGRNTSGQCDVPPPDPGYTAISAGGAFGLALKRDGSIVSWGSNSSGQCDIPEPNTGFTLVSAGGGHSLGLRNPDLGACCHPNGACTITREIWCEPPSVWNGSGTFCVPSPCALSSAESVDAPDYRLTVAPNPSAGAVTIRWPMGKLQDALAIGPIGSLWTAPGWSGAATSSPITMEIFDASGRMVRRLTDSAAAAGKSEITWDGRDPSGKELPAGIYLLRVASREGASTHTLVRTK